MSAGRPRRRDENSNLSMRCMELQEEKQQLLDNLQNLQDNLNTLYLNLSTLNTTYTLFREPTLHLNLLLKRLTAISIAMKVIM